LICEIGEEFGVTFDSDVANWLYAAIATDTGWFRFPSTSARTMRIAARLMDLGAIPHYVYNMVHEQSSLARVRLGGRVLARTQVEADGRLAWIYADSKDMLETGAVPSDTEGLVNVRQGRSSSACEVVFLWMSQQSPNNLAVEAISSHPVPPCLVHSPLLLIE
jgi:phosphoesterase RecJ-like protein